MKSTVLLITGVLLAASSNAKNDKMEEVFHWKQVDYAFPDKEARESSIKAGKFVPENNLPLGLEVWNDKLFITVPRWKSGIPSSLNYVKIGTNNKSPAFIPYPSWEANRIHDGSNETKIISTFRIRADECDRLWVIDTGLADILGKPEQITPPKILIYDLKTDKLLKQYEIKKEHIKEDSFFANIIVDVTPETCDKAFAYIPDLGSYALIVYSLEDDDSYRVKHHYFYFDPLSGNYNVAGINFQWTDGIFGLALSPVQKDGYRTAYFHPLSSTREFAVSTKILQNETLASSSYYEYKVLGSRGPNTQATASFLDEKTGVLLYTQVNRDGIGCWNSYKHANEYSADTNGIVSNDNETMVFPNDLKVDRNSNLWVLTDRLPVHIYRTLDPNEYNYRIFRAPVKDLVKGTICEV